MCRSEESDNNISFCVFQASKETIADVYNDITLANALHVANITIINVHNTTLGVGNTISDGVDATITISMNKKYYVKVQHSIH